MPRGVCTRRNNISPPLAPRTPTAVYDRGDRCAYISIKTRGRTITATSPYEVYARRKNILGTNVRGYDRFYNDFVLVFFTHLCVI